MRKLGDTVTIYEDPLTEEKPEGEAVLVKRIKVFYGGMVERWLVRFSDGSEVARNLGREKIVPKIKLVGEYVWDKDEEDWVKKEKTQL